MSNASMERILEWSELIAYWTASMAALIYIFDTSFIYLSGIKKQLKLKRKKTETINQSPSRPTSPATSMVLERFSQHPQYRRNYVVSRENGENDINEIKIRNQNPLYTSSSSSSSLCNNISLHIPTPPYTPPSNTSLTSSITSAGGSNENSDSDL